jgi:hypothetical protein
MRMPYTNPPLYMMQCPGNRLARLIALYFCNNRSSYRDLIPRNPEIFLKPNFDTADKNIKTKTNIALGIKGAS